MDSELPAGLYVIACRVSSAPRPSLTELFVVVIVVVFSFFVPADRLVSQSLALHLTHPCSHRLSCNPDGF